MSIVRGSRAKDQYTVVSNEVLRDSRLSYRARGILVCILSRPDNWRTTARDLAYEGKEGRDAVGAALNELENAGYLVRRKYQNEKGHWISESVVYDTPQATEDWKPVSGESDPGESGPIRSNEKKEREEEPRPTQSARHLAVIPTDFGGSGGDTPVRPRKKRKREVHPDEGGKPPAVRSGDLMDYFVTEWSTIQRERTEFAMVPVYAVEKACYAWLRNKFLAPAKGRVWKPEEVLRLMEEFMRDVRYGAITPKPGINAWQMFQTSHTKFIHRVPGMAVTQSTVYEDEAYAAAMEENRRNLAAFGLT